MGSSSSTRCLQCWFLDWLGCFGCVEGRICSVPEVRMLLIGSGLHALDRAVQSRSQVSGIPWMPIDSYRSSQRYSLVDCAAQRFVAGTCIRNILKRINS
jgi:hypothetical protein